MCRRLSVIIVVCFGCVLLINVGLPVVVFFVRLYFGRICVEAEARLICTGTEDIVVKRTIKSAYG
jgi:hypothetical protein